MGIPVLLLFLVAASFTDLKYRYIDNFQTLFFLFIGLILTALDKGLYGVLDGMLTALVIFLLLFVFFTGRLIGAGDIKFIMAIAVFTGHETLVRSVIPITAFAVAAGIVMIIRERKLRSLKIPMALPISLGVIWELAMV